jgi:HD-GYP domain-containing protein (c-di-GMP phosphodiesterase class II)
MDPEIQSALPIEKQSRLSSLLGEMRSSYGLQEQQLHTDVMRLLSAAQAESIDVTEPDAIYRMILNATISFIPDVDSAMLALVEDEVWRIVAGHHLNKRAVPRIMSPFAERDQEVIVIDAENGGRKLPVAPGAKDDLFSFLEPITYMMVGSFSTSPGVRLVLFLESGAFGHESRKLEKQKDFETVLNMGPYLRQFVASRVEAQRKSAVLQKSYTEIEALSGKLKQVLTLTGRLGDEFADLETFFEELLKTSLMVVDVADYGSVSLIEGDTWRFVTAIGHDAAALRNIRLPAEQVVYSPEVRVVEDILALSHQSMDADTFAQLKSASKPIKSSLIINLPATENTAVNLTLDIAAESEKTFARDVDRLFRAFANLATGFLKLRLSAEAVQRSYVRFANKLALVAEAHDQNTGLHNRRVAYVSGILAEKYPAPKSTVDDIYHFASLHDIGKLFLDRSLISRNGALTPEEYQEMQRHAVFGERVLDDPMFKVARNIAVYHHERFDGSGYPYGLKGEEIPLEARIVAVADVYDALRSERSYKGEMPPQEALRVLRHGDDRTKPEHFEPYIVQLLDSNLEEIEQRVYQREIRDEDLWLV